MKPMKKVLSLLCSLLCVLFIGSSVPAFAYQPCCCEKKLYKAILYGNILTVIRIINNQNIDVDARCGDFGKVPLLFHAIYGNNYAIAKLLLEHGADANSRADTMATPLIVACDVTHPNLAIITLLIAYGADVSAVDENNENALHMVFSPLNSNGGDAVLPIVHYLLEVGVDPNVTNKWGENALDACREKDPKSPKTEELLKQYGAKSAK